MTEISGLFLAISGILFFGFIAEFFFKKFHLPDLILLVLMGFILGPHVLHFVTPEQIANAAPAFTTFALMFILFEGAFKIDLASFAKSILSGFSLAILNFAVSFIVISGILIFFNYDVITSILIGSILGGVSSVFVIPVIGKLRLNKETYSMLLFESTITDVLTIVFAITVMELIGLNAFSFQVVAAKIVTLFAVAGYIGIAAGALWIFIDTHIFKDHRHYMVTIAYLLLVYVIAEYLNGNGAIAALFFGIMLKNSKILSELFVIVKEKKTKKTLQAMDRSQNFASATTSMEQIFYSQITFFIKTFFFVYIGVLFDVGNIIALSIGAVIAAAILISRGASSVLTKEMKSYDRKIVNSIFARGLAPAVVVQLTFQYGIPGAASIVDIVYSTIVFTILFSSAKIFAASKKKTPSGAENKIITNKKSKK
jgi:potassium/hydrogen antiporter